MPVALLPDDYDRRLVDLGRQAGLDAVGIAPAAPFTRARAAIEDRKRAGLHGGMAFTFKNPARSTDPGASVRDARAVVVGARSYLLAEPAEPAELARPSGRVARYAWVDHYAPLRAALSTVAQQLRRDGWRAVVFADDNSMVDREAAWLAGIGWFGKNANLLVPGGGSWFVLGAVVTDAPLPPADAPQPDGCGTCRRCLDGCPTGAIVAPGVVDANRCLAWLLQKPGVFARQHRVALGGRIYGCDDCQEVCPPNHRRERDTAPQPAPDDATASVDLVDLLDADDATILARHGRWYLADRDPRWLRRNALIALANTASPDDERVAAVIGRYLLAPDGMLRAHALWASRRLGRADLAALVAADQHPDVVGERSADGPPVVAKAKASVQRPNNR